MSGKVTDFVENLKEGQIVAFNAKDDKVLSGIVKEINTAGSSKNVLIETKNGILFELLPSDILWVKTSERWPRFIMDAFKGTRTEH